MVRIWPKKASGLPSLASRYFVHWDSVSARERQLSIPSQGQGSAHLMNGEGLCLFLSVRASSNEAKMRVQVPPAPLFSTYADRMHNSPPLEWARGPDSYGPHRGGPDHGNRTDAESKESSIAPIGDTNAGAAGIRLPRT